MYVDVSSKRVNCIRHKYIMWQSCGTNWGIWDGVIKASPAGPWIHDRGRRVGMHRKFLQTLPRVFSTANEKIGVCSGWMVLSFGTALKIYWFKWLVKDPFNNQCALADFNFRFWTSHRFDQLPHSFVKRAHLIPSYWTPRSFFAHRSRSAALSKNFGHAWPPFQHTSEMRKLISADVFFKFRRTWSETARAKWYS